MLASEHVGFWMRRKNELTYDGISYYITDYGISDSSPSTTMIGYRWSLCVAIVAGDSLDEASQGLSCVAVTVRDSTKFCIGKSHFFRILTSAVNSATAGRLDLASLSLVPTLVTQISRLFR